jgi:hypothetical protein
MKTLGRFQKEVNCVARPAGRLPACSCATVTGISWPLTRALEVIGSQVGRPAAIQGVT